MLTKSILDEREAVVRRMYDQLEKLSPGEFTYVLTPSTMFYCAETLSYNVATIIRPISDDKRIVIFYATHGKRDTVEIRYPDLFPGFFSHHRKYSSATTVMEKVHDYIRILARRAEEANREKIGTQVIFNMVKAMHPEATVTELNCSRSTRLIAKFPNGLSVTYGRQDTIQNDGSPTFAPYVVNIDYGLLDKEAAVVAMKKL